MKWYRAIFLFIWMLGIAVSSYAGIKKCPKQLIKPFAHASLVAGKQSLPVEKSDAQQKDICAASIIIYCQQQEEVLVNKPLRQNYVVPTPSYFYLHTQKPFLPPRLAESNFYFFY